MAAFDTGFPGRSQMAALMREFDWANSPLGRPEEWPSSLRSAVRICLTSRFPMIVWWGPELRYLYNDAYLPLLGTKHPALGMPGREVWGEIWHIIGPMLDSVLETGEATWSEDLLLPMNRHGYWEETYWTYSYSPLHDDDGTIRGVFTAVSDTTERVIGERRLAVLNDLGSQSGIARSVTEAASLIASVLDRARIDIPYAEVHLRDPETGALRLAAVSAGQPVSARADGPGGWPLAEAIAADDPLIVTDVGQRFGTLPSGDWETAPTEAIVTALHGDIGAEPVGVIVLAAGARRALDEPYQTFLGLVARQAATVVNGAVAYQVQQRRAEELAELDQAKTAFFSNISHEFRTPLTLIMGPVAELRARLDEQPPDVVEDIEVIHRNGLRLGKLVNALLDFSRIEAGRMQARYEPVDLAQLTAELASVFRAAVDNAGLTYRVDCQPLREPVYVDREMWEKVILNLLSNAVKFTFDGTISVTVRDEADGPTVRVIDSGVGVPADEMPRLFERFHRIPTARARSNEGSGIGLAMVRELVGLHGGRIMAESSLGVGTAFTISLPYGHDHLPAEQLVPAGPAGLTDTTASFVTEALRWLPTDVPAEAPSQRADPAVEAGDRLGTVLVADDNADMREYLVRLLTPGYHVRAVPSGTDALMQARAEPPDLIVSDVMMPGIDGLELVARLRDDPRTAGVPVLLLSARAGQEAAVEGLAAGADDYLVKPFAAAELLARVRANVVLARLRNHHARWRSALINSLQEGFFLTDDQGTVVEINAAFADILGVSVEDAPFPVPHPWWPDQKTEPDDHRTVTTAFERARTRPSDTVVVPVRHQDGRPIWVAISYNTVLDANAERVVVGTLRDVTAEQTAIQRDAALATMNTALADANDFDEVVDAALAQLAALWPTGRPVAVYGNPERPTVRATDREHEWSALSPDIQAAVIEVRGHAPLGVQVDPAGGTIVLGAGASVDYPDGTMVVWLRFATPRPFGADDQTLLALLAGSLGRALHRAHLFGQQRDVALALQRAILGPHTLPAGFAVRYEPAVSPLEVGGDWFDVMTLPDERIGIVVGDCVGRGLPAAAVMGQLRSAGRALLLQATGPARTLAALDDFAARIDGAWCTTVFCGVLDPATGELTYSSAGHPPGIVVTAAGAVQMLDESRGLPLAIRPGTVRPEATATIPRGGGLLCYTDGLVERRGQSLLVGIDSAAAVLRETLTGEPTPARQADRIMARLQPTDGFEDDVALLLYRHDPVLRVTVPAVVAELGPARARLRSWLEAQALPTEFIQGVLVAAGEACANAIEHAYAEAPGEIRMTVRLVGDVVRLRIVDSGQWRPPNPAARPDRGRGLALMRAFMDSVTIQPDAGGTTVDLEARVRS